MPEPSGSLNTLEGAAKTKVFLSYSRRNLDFAEKLNLTLEARGYDVLLDRTDIAAGEDWRARLGALIVAADTVVFVVSPSSADSEVCAWEVAEAARLGKRILPVIAKKTNEKTLPPELARLNFIFFDGRKFDDALADLSIALKQDLPWLREHTRLGDLALQWNGQKAGVLRGTALEAAEQWIASPPREAGLATDQQRQFIAVSRKAATQRQRYWIAGILAVALVSIGLTILSEINRREAEKQTARAEAAVAAATSAANDMVFELAVRFKNSSGIPAALIKDVLERARGLQKKLADSGETNPSVQLGSAKALVSLVDTYLVTGELTSAANAAQDAIATLEGLAKSSPDNMEIKRYLGVSYIKIGNVSIAQNVPSVALEQYRKSSAFFETIASHDENNAAAKVDLCASYDKIGDVQLTQGMFTEALENYQKVLVFFETMAKTDKTDTGLQRNISVSYTNIGDVFKAKGALPAALESYRKSLAIDEILAKQEPGNTMVQRDLGISYQSIGDLSAVQGDLPGALESYRKNLTIMQTLAQQDQGNAKWQRGLSLSFWRLAVAGDAPRENYGKALNILKKLKAEGKLQPADEPNILKLEKIIAGLT